MISALDEVESVARCIEMGVEDDLPKSFNPTVLRARIHASLTRKFFRDRERASLHSVEQLTETATAVQQESYNHDDSLIEVVTRDDELGHLARVFQAMVRNVYQREQRLKQQVRELRLGVDKIRRDREVEESISTDYFKHLNDRAVELRRRD